VGESARVEVCPYNLRPSDVLGVIDLISLPEGSEKGTLVIGIAIEKASTLGELIVGATEDIGRKEGGSKSTRKSLKRRSDWYGCEYILLGVLCVEKEKCLVSYDWPSEITPELRSLKGRAKSWWRGQPRGNRTVPE
jgi:hypothetical protein